MFSHLCPYTPFIMTILFSNLWCFGSLLKTVMPKLNAQAGAMVGTTCSFNEINTNKEEKINDIDKWNNYAKQLNIITTIGSDFHNFDSIHPIVGLINEDINLTLNDINNILYNLNN